MKTLKRDQPDMGLLIMSEKQRDLARQALGLPNDKNRSSRNHAYVSPGTDAHSEWRDLVTKGLATRCEYPLASGDSMFHLTLEGARRARDPKETISRASSMHWRKNA